jgi:nucleotide-binding universal stress UspA family protein
MTQAPHSTTHWLVPFDGSEHALHALQLAIQEARQRVVAPTLHVLNVQLPISADMSRFIDSKVIDGFHRETGDKALASAVALLKGTELTFQVHVLVGDIAHSIASFATSHDCSLIVMGTRGQSSVMGLIMGSVTTRLLHEAKVPVLLTR